MQEQLDRIERKINRIGHLVIVALAAIGILAIAEIPALIGSFQDNLWATVAVIALVIPIIIASLVLRRPFRK